MVTRTFSFLGTIYHLIIKFFAHHKTYTAFLFVMMVAILGFFMFSEPKVTSETHIVTYGDITQYVKVSGSVSSSRDANLSFQTGGAVSYVGVRAGDKVEQGRTLATLSSADAQSSLLQAQASLVSAEATLEQLKQGARKEEVALKEQLVINAKNSLNQAYGALPDSIQNTDSVTADTVKNKFSNLFILSSGRYMLSFSPCDQRLLGDLENKRTELEDVLADFQKHSGVITAISSEEAIDKAFEKAYLAALKTNDLVNTISALLLAPCSISNTSLDGYRTLLSLVKPSMTALFADITSKRSALNIAKNTFNQASRDLELTKAGTDPFKIKAQAALVSQAEATVAQAKSGLLKTMIVAPFSGTVSKVDLSIGENVTVGRTVISMIATDGFEVEAKIPEIDIVKVSPGAEVEITLDAYGRSVIFPGVVTRINPVATTEGTVPVYTAIVTFVGKDDRVKEGMTANVKIVTSKKTNSIVIPSRFVTIDNPKKGTVTIFKDSKGVSKEVALGLRGEDGLIEIMGGLTEGEMLLPPVTKDRGAQKQTTSN